jgi:hypothetical protein
MSERGIEAGNRWLKEIDEQLETTNFGILFVTPENQTEPWLVHEAGALAKGIEESRVVPVAIDMEPSDIDWPLARFQAKRLNEDGVWDILNSINSVLESDQLPPDVLERSFEAQWSRLEENLDKVPELPEEDMPKENSPEEVQEERDKKLDEVLELVRSMSREDEVRELGEFIAGRLQRLESHILSPGPETGGTHLGGEQLITTEKRIEHPLTFNEYEKLVSLIEEYDGVRGVRSYDEEDGRGVVIVEHESSLPREDIKSILSYNINRVIGTGGDEE